VLGLVPFSLSALAYADSCSFFFVASVSSLCTVSENDDTNSIYHDWLPRTKEKIVEILHRNAIDSLQKDKQHRRRRKNWRRTGTNKTERQTARRRAKQHERTVLPLDRELFRLRLREEIITTLFQ
jgi:hypothetical protein